MSDDNGTVTTERDGHVMVMTVDRVKKRNSFTPEMFDQLSDALGALDRDPDLWVGVLQFAGDHTSAGLDLPRFFGPGADTRRAPDPDAIDVFSMNRRCSKPVVVAVQGIVLTIAIEMMLGFDIVIAADDCRFRQLEPRRGLA
ncbi:MAG: enoyl-CoA hydratase, partial [Gammaproteobacteria bacterium]|nr:enoyl-CoA hydratase [Gammaproteobacteria bacterium]